MCLGISSFDSINNDNSVETTGSVASNNTGAPSVASIFGGDFSGSTTNIETSGQVALLFSDLSLDGGGSEGEVTFGGFSGGGGGSCGGGGMSLA